MTIQASALPLATDANPEREQRTLKVVHLVGSFHHGGSERQAIQLTMELCRLGWLSVQLACLDDDGPLRDVLSGYAGDIPCFPLTSFHDWTMVRRVREFADFLRSVEASILHTHDFYTNVFGMIAGTVAAVPVRIASRRESGAFRTRSQKWVERNIFRFAHAIVANSESVCVQLGREGIGRDRIVRIYNGVNVRRSADLAAARSDGVPVVGMVANFRHEIKDHRSFLSAAQQIRKIVPSARFVLVGEGELLSVMQAYASDLGLSDCTAFTGAVADAAEIVRDWDVCVLSSRSEGFSNAVLEYMAASKPVVCTDVSGAREAIVDGVTGFIVPIGDVNAIAERVVALLRSPELASHMGRRGRRRVEEHFSLDAQTRAVARLYRNFCTGKGILEAERQP